MPIEETQTGILRGAGRLALPVTGLFVSIASVALLVRLVDVAQVEGALAAADLGYVGVATLFLLASYPLRSFRWSILLDPIVTMPQRDVLSALALGLLGNTLLPARAGDIARGLLVGQKTGIGTVTTLATIVAERLLDVAANLFIVLILGFAVGLPKLSSQWVDRGLGAGATGVLLVAGLGLCVAAWRVVTRRAPRWLQTERARDLRQRLAIGLRVFANWRTLSRAIVWSLMIWCVLGMVNYWGMVALGIRLPLHAAFAVMVAQTVGVAIPSLPAYVGTFHMATVLALSLYGVPAAVSLPFAVVTHAMGIVVSIVAGVPFLWYEGLSARDLWRPAVPASTTP